MGDKPPEHRGRLRLELKHEPTDDGIELVCKGELGGIALHERDVRERCLLGPLARDRNRGRRPVDADYGASLADELTGEERDVTATSPDVEDAHPAGHAGLDEEPARYRIDQRGLKGQPPKLDLRVAEDIGRGLRIASGHADSFRPRHRPPQPRARWSSEGKQTKAHDQPRHGI